MHDAAGGEMRWAALRFTKQCHTPGWQRGVGGLQHLQQLGQGQHPGLVLHHHAAHPRAGLQKALNLPCIEGVFRGNAGGINEGRCKGAVCTQGISGSACRHCKAREDRKVTEEF